MAAMGGVRAPAHGVIAPPPPLPSQQPHDTEGEEDDVALFRLNALQTLGDWSVHDDGDGRLFYYNSSSAQSQWEPPVEFTGLEGELMMKLMLQHAVARSGFWSAHDAGNGTLYYFNERTRESVWERPEDWGLAPPPPPPPAQEDEDKEAANGVQKAEDAGEGDDADVAIKKPKKEKKKKAKKPKKSRREEDDEDGDGDGDAVATAQPEKEEREEEKEEVPQLSTEEIEAAKQKEAAELKRIENFRQMLRDKKIMPFTKWSVAMPRIISDSRFMAIPTMEERRAIFEHFVAHRRDDLKAEKKAKLKDAKKAFSALLREQFARQLQDGTWDSNTSLPVFLTTLEGTLDTAQYKSIQENAMALLPTSVQEKLYDTVMSEYKEESEKIKTEESGLFGFLQQKLTGATGASLRDAGWESEQMQELVASFYASKEANGSKQQLLSKEKQRAVYRRVQDALNPRPAPTSKYGDSKYGGGLLLHLEQSLGARTATIATGPDRALPIAISELARDRADEQERREIHGVLPATLAVVAETTARLVGRHRRLVLVLVVARTLGDEEDRLDAAADPPPPPRPAHAPPERDRIRRRNENPSAVASLVEAGKLSSGLKNKILTIFHRLRSWHLHRDMEASVDTLVYQLEDEDPQVRWQTLVKLRKIAVVESAHFPVRNPRRFLHCVRRRILDDEPQNALEALRLVTDIMGVLGDDVDQILSSILPHLVSCLPKNCGVVDGDDDAAAHVALHEETFQVFRKYVVISNDLKAVAELLMNMGLAHAGATVREASILAIVRLLEERYARKTKGARANFKANRMDKALFVALFQALVPVLEDNNENIVVVAEEALGKLHLYWGDGIDDIMQFLSSEDRKTLRAHQEHVNEFLQASCSENATPPSTSSSTATLRISSPESPNDLDRPTTGSSMVSSSSSSSSSTTRLNTVGALHFGFVSDEILKALKTTTSNSNSDWKRRSAAVEKLFSALKQANPAVLQRAIDEMEELFDIIIRLMQDADVHLVKRAIQITQVCFYKFSDHAEGGASQNSQGSESSSHSRPPQNAAFYMQKMVPHLVETAANFAEDAEMEAHLYALFTQFFQSGFLSVARASQALLSSLQHRRLQVREEACKVWMLLLLVAKRDGFNISKVLSHNMLQVLGRLLGDSSARVKEMAIEAGAMLAAVTKRSDLPKLVEENLDEYLVEQVDMDGFRRRLRQKHLPTLLDNGLLSLTQVKKKAASVRNSYGSTATTPTTNITERSLSSVSELHMLAASREFAPEYPPAVVRQSRHHLPPSTESVRSSLKDGGSIRTSTTPETTYGADTTPTSKFGYQSPSVATSITGKTLAGTGGGGSMSDHSYFIGSDEATKQLTSSSSAPVADKLAMLKKKATQLRKSSSSRQLHNVSASDTEKGSTLGYSEDCSSSQKRSNQPPMRSHTSPEQYGDRTEDEPVVSARRQRKEETTPVVVARPAVSSRIPKTISQSPPDSNLSSPQKIQMLQSSGATVGVSFEDRPIVSKYAVTAVQSQGGGYDDGDHDVDPPKAKVPFKSSKNFQRHDNSSPTSKWSNNESEAPLKKAPPRVVSAARMRPDVEQLSTYEQDPKSEVNFGGDGDYGDMTTADTYVPSGKAVSAASRPISLATRKRLEAKAKQDGLALNSNSPSKDPSFSSSVTSDPSSASVDDVKPLQKKASLIAMAKAGNLNSSERPSGFGGKQEPKYLELHEIKPLANPKQEVSKLLDKIRGADWEATFDALSIVRRLAMHHPIFLEDKIHAVTKEILGQVPNLRSTVSKNSLLALESMCSAYQKAMDTEVDAIIAVLIKRSTDSNTFVCESATSSINSVILHCSANKVVNALAVHLTSKAVPLRREVARAMHTLIVSMADQIQSSKDLGTILNIVGKCLEDSNNEVRDAAKQSILYLCYEQRIDAEKLKRMLSGGARSKVDQVLSGNAKYTPSTVKLPVKAVAKSAAVPVTAAAAPVAPQTSKAKPEPSMSSSSNASGTNSRTDSLSSSGSSGVPVSRKVPSASGAVVDTVVLEKLQKSLESSNWKDRYDALQETTAFVCSGATAKVLTESGKVTGLFDLIIKRMEDGNAKVNVFALECLEKMIPALGNGMELVLSSFLPVLTKNLAANNPKLSSLTHTVIQVLCGNVEAKLLCQHFAAIARHANSRIKPLLIDTLDQLVATSDEKNQYALNRYVLPLALELMKEAKSDVKDANTRLLRSLYASLGPTMLQAVYKQSTSQQERITAILGISSFAKG